MRVLITGASGFLGSWFLDHFIREGGHDLWSVDIEPHPTGLPIDQVDLETFLADFDTEVDLALHFAAPVGGRIAIERDPMYNADAFRLDSVFFRWAVKHAQQAVYPSSSAIYPTALQGSQGHRLLQEGHIDVRNTSWGAPDELYGFSKLAGEIMAWKAFEKYGLSTLCIRPFSGYGPGQSFDYPIPAIARRVAQREDPLIIWGGYQKRDFIYVEDIVMATIARLTAGVSAFETMNISSGQGTDFLTIAKGLSNLEGYEPQITSNTEMPIGVMHRRGDNVRMTRYYQPKVPLAVGLGYVLDSIKAAAHVA